MCQKANCEPPSPRASRAVPRGGVTTSLCPPFHRPSKWDIAPDRYGRRKISIGGWTRESAGSPSSTSGNSYARTPGRETRWVVLDGGSLASAFSFRIPRLEVGERDRVNLEDTGRRRKHCRAVDARTARAGGVAGGGHHIGFLVVAFGDLPHHTETLQSPSLHLLYFVKSPPLQSRGILRAGQGRPRYYGRW